MLRHFFFGSDFTGTTVATIGFTLLRIFAGVGLITHGFGKLPPPEGFVGLVASLGFPAPIVFAWAAALAEAVGGALILAGFLTRPAAFFALTTMLVAALGQHYNDPFAKKELALLYAFLALCFLLAGAGDWSVDALVRGNIRPARRRWLTR